MTNQQNRERTKIFYLLLRLHQGHIFGPQKIVYFLQKKIIKNDTNWNTEWQNARNWKFGNFD